MLKVDVLMWYLVKLGFDEFDGRDDGRSLYLEIVGVI